MNTEKISSKSLNFSFEFSNLINSDSLIEISSILSNNPSLINHQDSQGLSPLSHAVQNSKIHVVRYLLSKGANPNRPNLIGETPLHFSVENSDTEISELLLFEKADPNCITIDGETPLHSAAFKGNTKLIVLLLDFGANPNIPDVILGRTPLFCAVQCEHLECIRILLSYGGNPYLENKEKINSMNAAKNCKIKKVLDEWEFKFKNYLKPIIEISDEEKNSFGYSLTESRNSINFTFLSNSFESLPNEKMLTLKNISEDTSASLQTKASCDDLALMKFLSKIKMQKYKDLLVNNGFDDLELISFQMISPVPITHKILENIGISKHGHRALLLMKFEQNAGITENRKNKEKNMIQSTWECCQPKLVSSGGIYNLKDWLLLLKLDCYLYSFEKAGYEDIGFMCAQMNSKYPIDEELLEKIGIFKIGHRMRILGKLMQDAENLKTKSEDPKKNCILL